MGSSVTVSLMAGCIILAVAIAAIVSRIRGRITGGVIAGLVVLVLSAMNAYQFSQHVGMASPMNSDAIEKLEKRAKELHADRLAQAPLAKANDKELVDRFANLFYESENTWTGRNWLGVQCFQNPNDAWIHQEIITELKPDYIIEAGTAKGGSALLWASILREVNPTGKIITLDISDPDPKAVNHPLWKQYVEFIKGSSTAPETVQRIAERVKGKQVLVILDSDHSQKHVAEELKAYSPMVPVGSYLIVQDTSVNGHPVYPTHGPGPMEALEAFLAADDRFQSDPSREILLFTLHPKGYLKRIK